LRSYKVYPAYPCRRSMSRPSLKFLTLWVSLSLAANPLLTESCNPDAAGFQDSRPSITSFTIQALSLSVTTSNHGWVGHPSAGHFYRQLPSAGLFFVEPDSIRQAAAYAAEFFLGAALYIFWRSLTVDLLR